MKSDSPLWERAMDRVHVWIGQLLVQDGDSGGSDGTRPLKTITRTTTSNTTKQQSLSSLEKEPVDWIALGVEITLRLIISIGSGYALLYMTRKALEGLNASPEEGTESESSINQRLSKILSKRKESSTTTAIPKLNHYERIMAQEVVHPDNIATSFADIGGLDEIKREIYQLAILPLVQPHLFRSKLVEPTKGILLYGKPGVGKTMLAKALAKEAHAVFLPLQLSKILSKWVGESNKLVAATFSLAHKLQPCILFVDELDTFLKANHDSTAYLDSIKAEFLTLWDGLTTRESSRVLILGATNRPDNIDAAILRRMPRTFEIPLPDALGRLDILERLVADEDLTEEARDFLPDLAQLTHGYSGSDLKELCKAAAMIKIHEHTADFSTVQVTGSKNDPFSTVVGEQKQQGGGIITELRPMTKQDWITALQKVQRTGVAAYSYGQEEKRERQLNDARGLANLLRSLSNLEANNNNNDKETDDMPNI